MRKVFCRCEVCKAEFMGVPGSVQCFDHREPPVETVGVVEKKSVPVKVYYPRTGLIEEAVEIPRGGLRHPRGVCQKCGAPLAKGSRSYCRKHENERIKEWRRQKAERGT